MILSPFQHQRDTLFGILAILAASFILSGMDALAKGLMRELPTLQVVWARYLFHTLIVGAIFSLQSGTGFMRSKRPLLQTLRALCLLCVTFGLYFAIRRIPLADATAILFFAPVLVTLLAGMFLHERVGVPEWVAVILGFIGVLFVVRPGFREFQLEILAVVVAALCLSVYFVLTRALRRRDSEQTTLFHTTVAGALVLSLLLPFVWVSPSPAQWGCLVLIGGLGASGHFLLVRAFHLAPAPLLSPFLNAQLVAAVLYSRLLFDDQLGAPFYIGAVLIVGAGLVVWVHQQLRVGMERRGEAVE